MLFLHSSAPQRRQKVDSFCSVDIFLAVNQCFQVLLNIFYVFHVLFGIAVFCYASTIIKYQIQYFSY